MEESDGAVIPASSELSMQSKDGPRGEVRNPGREIGLPQPGRQSAQRRNEHQPRETPDHTPTL